MFFKSFSRYIYTMQYFDQEKQIQILYIFFDSLIICFGLF